MAINFGILNPNIPLAAGRTADLGQAMSSAEAIIGAKNRNKLLEMQMAEFEANAPVRELARVQAAAELKRMEGGQLTPEQMEENRKLLGNLTLAYRALQGGNNREAFADVLASVGDRGNGPFSQMIQIAQAGVQEAMQTGDWSKVDAQSEQIMGMFQTDKEPSAFMEKVVALADTGVPWTDAVRQVALGRDPAETSGGGVDRALTPEEASAAGIPPEHASYFVVDPDTNNIKPRPLHYDIDANPVTGETEMLDRYNQTVTTLTQETPDVTQVVTPTEQSLWDATEEGTGIFNAASRGAGWIAEKFGGTAEFAEEERQAKARLDLSTRQVIRAMSLSTRYPVLEQERIRETVALLPSLATEPAQMRAQMVPLDGYLSRAIAEAERDALPNSGLDPAARKDAKRTANAMRSFLYSMNVPMSEKEDIRSFAQALPNFFSMPRDKQDRLISMAINDPETFWSIYTATK